MPEVWKCNFFPLCHDFRSIWPTNFVPDRLAKDATRDMCRMLTPEAWSTSVQPGPFDSYQYSIYKKSVKIQSKFYKHKHLSFERTGHLWKNIVLGWLHIRSHIGDSGYWWASIVAFVWCYSMDWISQDSARFDSKWEAVGSWRLGSPNSEAIATTLNLHQIKEETAPRLSNGGPSELILR